MFRFTTIIVIALWSTVGADNVSLLTARKTLLVISDTSPFIRQNDDQGSYLRELMKTIANRTLTSPYASELDAEKTLSALAPIAQQLLLNDQISRSIKFVLNVLFNSTLSTSVKSDTAQEAADRKTLKEIAQLFSANELSFKTIQENDIAAVALTVRYSAVYNKALQALREFTYFLTQAQEVSKEVQALLLEIGTTAMNVLSTDTSTSTLQTTSVVPPITYSTPSPRPSLIYHL